MRKIITIFIILSSVYVNLYGKESLTDGLLFHFDFLKAEGKRVIADQTGKFKCLSEGYDFHLQNGGLRIAPEAKIAVPMPKKMNGKQMSFSLWLITDGKTKNVIFFKGLHLP